MPEPAERAASPATPEAPTADAVFKALADPHRRQILHLVQLSALHDEPHPAQPNLTTGGL